MRRRGRYYKFYLRQRDIEDLSIQSRRCRLRSTFVPMHIVRRSELADLSQISSWISSEEEVTNWAGPRVPFPIKLDGLSSAIQWECASSISIVSAQSVIGFGQVVPKGQSRQHLARLIVDPAVRGSGLGRLLANSLIQAAQAASSGKISLNVEERNRAAISLYRSLGFVECVGPDDEPVTNSIYMELGSSS